MVLFFHTKRKRGSEMNLLYVDHVSKTYGQGETAVHALKEACFSVPKGEFVAIVGQEHSVESDWRTGYPNCWENFSGWQGCFFHERA